MEEARLAQGGGMSGHRFSRVSSLRPSTLSSRGFSFFLSSTLPAFSLSPCDEKVDTTDRGEALKGKE